MAWLRAEKVPMRDLRDIGINRRLESTSDGVDLLNDLIRVLQREGTVRIVLLLDEIQEIDQLDQKRRTEAIGGLHKVFDRNTKGLTMLLSFTVATQAQVKRIIGEALFDRRSDTLTLPPIAADEGVELIEGIMHEWSIEKSRSPFPFTTHAIQSVVAEVAKYSRALTPRDLVRAFDKILAEAEFDLAEGTIDSVDEAYALDRLTMPSEEETE
jgi:hypothetical protein